VLWTESTAAGLHVYGSSLNESRSPVDLRPRLNRSNRYTGAAVPPAEQRRSAAAAVTHQTWALHALQGSILDTVWTNVMGAMWRACFTYLEEVVDGDDGRRWGPFFLKLGRWSGGLRCTFGNGEHTSGGGRLRRSFLGGWLDADGCTMVRRRLRRQQGFELGLDGENRSGRLLI
jgi:hypothetical protein